MALFEKIIAKIRRELPVPTPIINLYNWGEPLLHPDLPAIITILHQAGMRSQLSTNLNVKRGLEAVIAAGADELKISLSGFSQETYSRPHARGNIDLVKANMRLVRQYADQYRVPTKIWVGHHLYRSNQHESDTVRQFCRQLDFAYHPIPAFYMPLERLLDVLHGQPNPRDSGIISDLLYDPGERRRAMAARRSGRSIASCDSIRPSSITTELLHCAARSMTSRTCSVSPTSTTIFAQSSSANTGIRFAKPVPKTISITRRRNLTLRLPKRVRRCRIASPPIAASGVRAAVTTPSDFLLAAAQRRLAANDRAGALVLLDELLRHLPDHAPALRMVAEIELPTNPVAAANAIHRVVQAKPDDLSAKELLSRALSAMGRHDEARRAFEMVAAAKPANALAQANLSISLLRAGDPHAAIAAAKRAIALDPERPEAYAALGHAHNLLHRIG